MKKSILISFLLMLFVSVSVFAQEEEDATIEELDSPPSLDELLERPKDIKVESIDLFKNASFDLYDKVIETRKEGEANGWPDQGRDVVMYGKEYRKLVAATAVMAKDIKSVPKLKLIFATKNFVASKKALTHSAAHIKYMRAQYSDEEWNAIETAAESSTGEEESSDGGGK